MSLLRSASRRSLTSGTRVRFPLGSPSKLSADPVRRSVEGSGAKIGAIVVARLGGLRATTKLNTVHSHPQLLQIGGRVSPSCARPSDPRAITDDRESSGQIFG